MANPYVKQTWTDGSSSASAARMGVIEQGVFDAHYMAAVRVFHNAAQSIATSTLTALAFNSERFDQESNASATMHDTVTNNSRLTCKTAGVFDITGNVEWASSATGLRTLEIRLNGATIIARQDAFASAASSYAQEVNTKYLLAVNDYVELLVFQSSGGALNVNASGNYSPEFMMVKVG